MAYVLGIYRSLNVTTDGALIAAGARSIVGYYLANTAASVRYVKFYDKATTATVGTDTPALTIPIPATGGANVWLGAGIPFTNGICIGATTAAADNSTAVPTSGDVVANVFYV